MTDVDAHVPSPAAGLAALRLLFGDPPWVPTTESEWEQIDHVLEAWRARHLAMAAIVRHHVPSSSLPPPVLGRLKRDHATVTAQSLELQFELERTLDALTQGGIEALPLKGSALYHWHVISEPGDRHSMDIDLLTHARDRRAVTATLQRLGFAQTHLGRSAKHLPAFYRGHRVVEVHEAAYWSVRDGHPVRLDSIPDSQETRLAHTLVHLVHHAFVSSPWEPWLVVKTIADVDAFERFGHGNPNFWATAEGVADEMGLAGELRALRDVRRWLSGADVRLSQMAEHILLGCRPLAPGEGEARKVAFYLRALREHPWWVTRARLAGLIAPSRQEVEARLGLRRGSVWAIPSYAVYPAYRLAEAAVRGVRWGWQRAHPRA